MRTRCLALRSATWVTEQELMTNAAAPRAGLSTTRTPFPTSRRAITSESDWFSLQPSVRTATVGLSCRDITGHHRTASAERETAGVEGSTVRAASCRSVNSRRPGTKRSLRRGPAGHRNQDIGQRGRAGALAVLRLLWK